MNKVFLGSDFQVVWSQPCKNGCIVDNQAKQLLALKFQVGISVLITFLNKNYNIECTVIPSLAWFLGREKNHVIQKSCYGSLLQRISIAWLYHTIQGKSTRKHSVYYVFSQLSLLFLHSNAEMLYTYLLFAMFCSICYQRNIFE